MILSLMVNSMKNVWYYCNQCNFAIKKEKPFTPWHFKTVICRHAGTVVFMEEGLKNTSMP